MRIEKAIELLSEYVYEDKSIPITAFEAATRLGIEALKEIHRERIGEIPFIGDQLPGETKD